MYVPKHFELNAEQIAGVLAGGPAGDLVTLGPDGLTATYLPMLYDQDSGALIGHLARVNDQWKHAGQALFLVHGPDDYVESDWLSTSQADSVPTWNYVTVQARGTLVSHDDPDWTLEAVRRLSTAHHDPAVEELPADAVERMLRAIVGIEVRDLTLIGKAKMSQNKSPEVVSQVIDGLRETGGEATAEWMAKNSLPRAQAKAAKLAAIRKGRPASLD